MADYSGAPEVREIAEKLIASVEQHADLEKVRIEYVWRDKHSVSKGRTVLAKARKISGLNAHLINGESVQRDLFVVEVADDTWQFLDESQRIALVDHELCHLRVDYDDEDTPQLSIRGHDLEEFSCIVERHGLWASDVARFGSAVAEQLVLAVDEVSAFLERVGDEAGEGESEDPRG